jgi:hypothetical protein
MKRSELVNRAVRILKAQGKPKLAKATRKLGVSAQKPGTPKWLVRYFGSRDKELNNIQEYLTSAAGVLSKLDAWPAAGKYGSVRLSGTEGKNLVKEASKCSKALEAAEHHALNVHNIAEAIGYSVK